MKDVNIYSKEYKDYKLKELIAFRLSNIKVLSIGDYMVLKDIIRICKAFELDEEYINNIKNKFKDFNL